MAKLMGKHTPGPWRAAIDMDGRHHGLSILTDAPEFNTDDGKEPYHPLIGVAYHGLGRAPRNIAEANATLMAQAPRMLEALEKMLLRYQNNLSPEWSDAQRIVNKAKGII